MATYLYNPSKPKAVKAVKPKKDAKKAKKAVGGFNLTPLISALLLAGIKLSLEQNNKDNKGKKITDERKSSKPKRRPRTV